MSFLSSLWSVLYHKNTHTGSYTLGQQLLRIIQARALALFCAFILGFGIAKLVPGLESQSHLLQDFLQDSHPLRIMIMVALVAPLTEELLFRSFLVPTKKTLSIALATWTVSLLMLVIPFVVSWSFPFQIEDKYRLLVLFKVFLFFLLMGCRYKILESLRGQRLILFLHKHIYGLLIISSLAFGWIHITNFTDHALRSMIVVVTLPQTLIGFVLGSVRIQGQLWHAIMIHCLYNATLIVPIALLLWSGIEIEQLSSPDVMETISFGQQMVVGGVSLWFMMVVIVLLAINAYTLIERQQKR